MVNVILNKQKSSVKVNKARSNGSNVDNGVPKGSVLAPVSNNIFIVDIYNFNASGCKDVINIRNK